MLYEINSKYKINYKVSCKLVTKNYSPYLLLKNKLIWIHAPNNKFKGSRRLYNASNKTSPERV